MLLKSFGIVDIIILVALVIGGINGFRSGIFVQLSSLIGIGFSIFFYTKFYKILNSFIKPLIDNKQMLPYISAATLFIMLSIVSMIIGQLLKLLIRMTPMGIFDRIIGAVIGSAKWFFFSGLIVWMLGVSNKKIRTRFIEKSLSQKVLHKFMPEIFKKMNKFPNVDDKMMKKVQDKSKKISKKINPQLDF